MGWRNTQFVLNMSPKDISQAQQNEVLAHLSLSVSVCVCAEGGVER